MRIEGKRIAPSETLASSGAIIKRIKNTLSLIISILEQESKWNYGIIGGIKMTMLCGKDRLNLIEELKEFGKRVMELGVESCQVGIMDNGNIIGTFMISNDSKLVCVLDSDNEDSESFWYENA